MPAITKAAVVPTRSLYVHVPFCRSRCSYCDFHSDVLFDVGLCTDANSVNAGRQRVQSWVQAIDKHLAFLKLGPAWKPYSTLYVGGGTPTALPAGILEDLLRLLAGSWAGTGSEWTMECNPDDLTNTMLDSFHAFGVNRLSIGIQSLEDSARQMVNRRGRANGILSALENLALLWKHNWSADFMYGMPGQTPEGLAHDIKRTIGLGAGHVSLYQLTLEEGTPLAAEVHRGTVRLPDPDSAADQYSAAGEVLVSAGFLRYEVSNWALTGQECQHNLHYWRMDDWEAIGPSGVSNRRVGTLFVRGANSSDDAVYETDPTGSVAVSEVCGTDAMFECLMMALRTSDGLSLQRFREIFGQDPASVFGNLPVAFPALLHDGSGYWRPSDEGLDMLNRVLVAALEAVDSVDVHQNDPETGG